MIETPFTRLLGARAPIQLAPMPGISTPDLVVAVADAGGVGMLPATLLPPEMLDAALAEIDGRTDGAFGVSFLLPFLDLEGLAVAAGRARLIDFFYGPPDAGLVERVHAAGSLASWQVGSLEEARAAQDCGCDVVIAQGTEAGGHVRGRESLLPLLGRVLDALRVPVLAAGGLASGRDLAAVLGCGAAGARIGTRFVASRESGAHPDYVSALLAASTADTCLTEAFSVMWPDAPHRVLRSAIAAAEARSDELIGETRHGGRILPVPRLSVICPTRDTTGPVEAMALYAGESVARVDAVLPAGEIVRTLVADAERALAAGASAGGGSDALCEHPQAARVRALFDAFRRRDLAAIRDAIDERAVWHFPGRSGGLAGCHSGHDGIFAFLARVGELSGGSFELELEDVLANDERAVALFRGRARRGERRLDNPTCLAIRLRDGRAVELHEFVWDGPAVDAFWS